MKKIQTYCPIFSGFYNTIWQAEEDREIEYINEQREQKGFEPIKFDDCDFDYPDYEERICKGVVRYLAATLQKEGIVKKVEFENIYSPREYNFRNDSINIVVTLTQANEKKILSILKSNAIDFQTFIYDRYTSRSGFISSYPNSVDEFMMDSPLEHRHKLGSILEFICQVLEVDELRMYEDVTGNTEGLTAKNYTELVETENLHPEETE